MTVIFAINETVALDSLHCTSDVPHVLHLNMRKARVQAADESEARRNGGAAAAEPDMAARYARGGTILRAMEQQGALRRR